jgi:hypothetical protein
MQGGLVPTTITVPTQPFFIFLTEQLRKKHDQLFKLRGPKKCNLTLQPCPFELAQLILQMCGAANSAHTVKLKQYHKLDPVFGQGWNRVEQEFKGQVDSILNVTQDVKVNYEAGRISSSIPGPLHPIFQVCHPLQLLHTILHYRVEIGLSTPR